jgi:hypothetical protein
MIFISDKQIIGNLKRAGFTRVEGKVASHINDAAFAFVKKALEKAVKKAVLKGGRVVLPSEFFGVASQNYIPEAKGTDMSVTDQLIRPPFQAQLNGGAAAAAAFKLGLHATKNMCREVAAVSHIEVTVRESAVKKIHVRLLAKLTDLLVTLKRLSKGAEVLSNKVVEDALAMKKFADMTSA